MALFLLLCFYKIREKVTKAGKVEEKFHTSDTHQSPYSPLPKPDYKIKKSNKILKINDLIIKHSQYTFLALYFL